MKKQIILGAFALLVLLPFPVLARLGPTIREERADVRQDLREIKKDVKGRGIKIVDGVVTAKGSSSLTVTKDGKTFTVNVDSNTRFRRHFWGKSSFAEIAVNDHVNVWGKFTDDARTTILATMIRDLSIQKRRGTFFGTISSKGVTTFVMHTLNRGDQTVTVGSTTKLVKRNQTTMTFADLKVNDRVRVKGVWDKTNSTITEVTQIKDFSQPFHPTPTPTP